MELSPESALVIRVPEADPFVRSLRTRYDPAAAGSIPAHITVNYPFCPENKSDLPLEQRLSALFSLLQPFEFTLKEIGKFPGILYLKPDPEAPFRQLASTIAKEFPESPPYGGIHKDLIPHLTIAHSEFIEDYSIVEYEIEKELEKLLPLSSSARKVSLLEYQNNAWQERISFELGTR
jgi:2'-5' RNA ligase